MSPALLATLVVAYIYQPADWLNLPPLGTVRSISSDQYSIYFFCPQGVFVFDRLRQALDRTVTVADGISAEIRLGAGDTETGALWLLSEDQLVAYNVLGRTVRRFANPLPSASSLGIGPGYVYLDDGVNLVRLVKKTGQVGKMPPGVPQVEWYGARSPYVAQRYIFLTPYYFLDESFIRHEITTLYEDRGTLWVGTEGYGLLAYDLLSHRSERYLFAPGSARAFQIFADTGSIWLRATDAYYRYDRARGTWRYYSLSDPVFLAGPAPYFDARVLRLERSELVNTFAPDGNSFWVGSEQGLYFFDPQANVLASWKNLGYGVYKVAVSGDTVRAATQRGLFRFLKSDTSWREVRDPAGRLRFGVYDIAQTRRARFYAVNGGVVVEDSTGVLGFRTWPGQKLSTAPRCLAGYGDFLFVGLESGLLVSNEATGVYRKLTTREGLLTPPVFALYADGQYVWAATAGGLSRFAYSALF